MLNIETCLKGSKAPFAAFILASDAYEFMQTQPLEICCYKIKGTGKLLPGTATFDELLEATYN